VRARLVELAGVSSHEASGLLGELRAARLVCFPTDTVYGLGGVLRPGTVEALVAAKSRVATKPLQVVYPTVAALLAALSPPPRLAVALGRLLPGPVTLVVPCPPSFASPPAGRGRDGLLTLGIRVPAWTGPARLLAKLDEPLVASSANVSGEPAGGPPPPASAICSETPGRCRARRPRSST
jgi:L-threonylcarbamoyladenylate synthase